MSLVSFTHRPVSTIELSSFVAEAARRMCRQGVGAVVIVDAGDGIPVGVFTDRDIVAMIADGKNPQEATVAQFSHAPLQVISIRESFDDALAKMRHHGVRRLPIVDEHGKLCGLASLDDLLVLLGNEMADAAATITGETDCARRSAEGDRYRPRHGHGVRHEHSTGSAHLRKGTARAVSRYHLGDQERL
jgi:CBS domain-containing protein